MRSVKRGCKKVKNYRFNHNNNKNKWKSQKRQRRVENNFVDNAWEKDKTAKQNIEQMGLVYDLNKAVKVPSTAPKTEKSAQKTNATTTAKAASPEKLTQVVQNMEVEANKPTSKTLRLSQPEIRYCIYMMEKYNEDYEAMAKDPKNTNQDTAAQIRKKILTFKSIPVQYNAYIRSKGAGGGSESMDTN